MAGDWIKLEKTTIRKPEVLRIAAELGIHPDHAFGLCVRFWVWCDDQLESGNARSVTVASVDALLDRAGFGDALLNVGWLRVRNGSLEVPNFERHMAESEKKRAITQMQARERKRRFDAKNGNAARVTGAFQENREQRREQPPNPQRGKRGSKDRSVVVDLAQPSAVIAFAKPQSEAEGLFALAAAAHAIREADDPQSLFRWLLKNRDKAGITQADEDAAREMKRKLEREKNGQK